MQYVYGYALVRLKDICNIKRGIRVVKNQLDDSFKYPVYQNSLIPLGNYSQYNQTANTAFVIAAGAAGQVGYSKVNFWAADDCFIFECSDFADSRYLYYQLLKQQNYLLSRVRKASVPRLSKTVLDNLSIPIPSIEEQNRIVSILDRFDSLCNDMKTGLPAEISARQQQYEYYRDKLLTFRKKDEL